MCRGPEAQARLRAFSCRRGSCWLCHRCSGRRLVRGPGCLVCPWAAARPRAVRAASCARRVVSKPGQALPPPTGTAARPSAPAGALHTGDSWCALPGHALPPPTGTAARPSAPAGALHTGDSWCALPGHAHLAPVFAPRTAAHPINFACNYPATISNLEFAVLELQRFLTLLNLRSIELHATFGGGLAVRQHPPHWWCVVHGVRC